MTPGEIIGTIVCFAGVISLMVLASVQIVRLKNKVFKK
jgi:hypothetical protein